MKYTILGFSQKVAIEKKLDTNDLLILRWFIDFKGTNKMVCKIINGEPYYWIKYNSIIEALPILNLKKDTVYRRLKYMSEQNILKHETIKELGTYSMYAIGSDYESMVSDINPEGYGLESDRVRIEIREGTDLNPDQKINLLKDSSIKNKKINNTIYNDVVESYNSTCVDLPQVKKLTVLRKKRIDKVLKVITMDELRLIFTKVHQSDFLSGRSGEWRSSFDWIFENDKNYIKILEGNYDNKVQKPKYENIIC